MKRLILFINSLEQREKVFLIGGIYLSIIILGIFILGSYNYERIKTLEKKISLETEKYVELQKLIAEYKNLKPQSNFETLSLSKVEDFASDTGIKNNIVSLKPYQHENNSIEVSFEKISGDQLVTFLKKIKNEGYFVNSININDPKGNGKLNVRIVIGDKT
ncbi:type II secretion system protein GspM [Persephonella sp.]